MYHHAGRACRRNSPPTSQLGHILFYPSSLGLHQKRSLPLQTKSINLHERSIDDHEKKCPLLWRQHLLMHIILARQHNQPPLDKMCNIQHPTHPSVDPPRNIQNTPFNVSQRGAGNRAGIHPRKRTECKIARVSILILLVRYIFYIYSTRVWIYPGICPS